jgi:hypothetical protein
MYDQEDKLYAEEYPDKHPPLRKVSWWQPETALQVLEEYVAARPNTRYFVFNDNDFASIPTLLACARHLRFRLSQCQSGPAPGVAGILAELSAAMAWRPKRYEEVGCLNREFSGVSEQRGTAEAQRLYPELDALLRHHSSKVEACF